MQPAAAARAAPGSSPSSCPRSARACRRRRRPSCTSRKLRMHCGETVPNLTGLLRARLREPLDLRVLERRVAGCARSCRRPAATASRDKISFRSVPGGRSNMVSASARSGARRWARPAPALERVVRPRMAAEIVVVEVVAVGQDVEPGPLLVVEHRRERVGELLPVRRCPSIALSSGRPAMPAVNQRGRGHDPVTVAGRIRSFVAVSI